MSWTSKFEFTEKQMLPLALPSINIRHHLFNMSGKAPRMSLRDFKQAARAKLAGSDPSSDVVVAPAHTTASRNRPPVTVFEQYVTLIDAEGNEYVVPQAILLASQTLRRLWRSRHKFAEHHQRVIRLDHLSGRIVEHVIKYCFQFYLESYAVFQPLDAAEPEHQSDIKVEPIPEVKIDSLDSLDSLDGGLDEPSTQSDLHDTDSVADVPEPPFVLPAIAIQFPLPPEDAYQVFLAAHYLNIPPLLRLAAAYCAQFVHQLDASALQLLNTELALEILKHLSPDSLLKFEMNHDLATLGIGINPVFSSNPFISISIIFGTTLQTPRRCGFIFSRTRLQSILLMLLNLSRLIYRH
jgi:hypothetical protein